MELPHHISKHTGAAVLSRALDLKNREMPPEGARFILNLGIRDEDKQRTLDLLSLQQQGHLTTEEHEELASYIEADNVLSILKAKALLVLKRAGQAL